MIETQTTYEALVYEQDEAVAILTMNRPERRNALNRALENDLMAALDRARDDEAVRAVILTGAGRDFCSGADLASFGGPLTGKKAHRHILEVYGPIVERIVTMEKPIVGALNGTAAGAGCSLALACDLRVMADDASLMQAFSNIGLVPDAGSTWLLARHVGYSRAFEICALGERLPAARCLALGLTNRVAQAGLLMEEARAWAAHLAQRPTLALGLTKKALHLAQTATLADTIAYEATLQERCIESEDHREGVMAFLEKRDPVFEGK